VVKIRLKNGDFLFVEDSAAMKIKKDLAGGAQFVDVPGQRDSISRNSFDRFTYLVPRKCTTCGEDVFEHLTHYCNYSGLNNLLNKSVEDTEAVRDGIKEFRRLVRSGVKNRDAFRQVWNKDIPEQSWGDRLDIERGIARICKDQDGREYVGYDAEKYRVYKLKQNMGPASVPYSSLPKEEPKGVQEKWYNQV